MTERLYFAHPVSVYDTPYEQAALALITHCFPGAEIENPNQLRHQLAYAEERKKMKTVQEKIPYFTRVVLDCSGYVGMPFLDGRFGLGVASEARTSFEKHEETFGMFLEKEPTPEHLAEWVANPQSGLFIIRPFTTSERQELLTADKETGSPLVIGHKETQLRTWDQVYSKPPKRPYERAHLVHLPAPDGFYPPEQK